MSTYNRLPITFEKGLGSRLWDTNGKEYIDAVSGVAVTNIGHCHPAVVEVIREQAGLLLHTSNLYGIGWQEQLGERLAEISGMGKAFFCNSGCEANEAALKISRLYARQKNIENPLVVVMENSFHGRTLATLAASGNRRIQQGFEPLMGGFLRVPYGDIQHILNLESDLRNRVTAILVEPIQGEGGVNPAPYGYLKALRDVCSQHDWLLMLDEVQTGMGRTGAWFAFQHEGIHPDVVTLAKGLGNGIPIGACLASGSASALFEPGSHGTTFGGNPLACRVACTVIDVINREDLLSKSKDTGSYLKVGLKEHIGKHALVKEVRGIGMMLGIELYKPCTGLAEFALDQCSLLINVTRDKVIRLTPAITMDYQDIDELTRRIEKTIELYANS